VSGDRPAALLTAALERRTSPAQARSLQEELAGAVREAPLATAPRLVAGLGVACDVRRRLAVAAAVVIDATTLTPVETTTATAELTFPYLPGLLAWRELPALLAAWRRLETRPDLVLCDGQGRAHPRRCGLACMAGLLLDIPAIGCAKSVLVGCHGRLGSRRGATADLVDGTEVIGRALRTRDGVRPVYVSVGHCITLDDAVSWVLRVARYRIPEPLRLADHAAAQAVHQQ
jgi:deoxyribonuclease V